MDFKVGPYTYRVTLAQGYLDLDGQPCLGLCDHEQQVLEISDRCRPTQRVQVMCHEYMEAWIYHFGHDGMDKEAYCDLFGLAMTQFAMDHTPQWCEQIPPPPLPMPEESVHVLAAQKSGQATDRHAQPPGLTGVRITEHFTPDDPPDSSPDNRGHDGATVPYESSCKRTGWRVRVIEPITATD